MPDAAPLEPITRPDGRLYRPRKITGNAVTDDGSGSVIGIIVLGTHDISRAQKLADICVTDWVDHGWVAAAPETGWYRLGYEGAGQCWVDDPVKGRAGVWFRDIVVADDGGDGSLTVVTIVTSPDRDPDSMTRSLSWVIPARSAQAFERAMTERYGEPVAEGLATVGTLQEEAERGAENGVVFTGTGETGDGH